MLRPLRFDLHLHTVLSPCGEIEMSPSAVAAAARKAGLSCFAVTDHNASANVPAYGEAASREGVAVIPGIEITSREEVHVLGYFDDYSVLAGLQKTVYASLPGRNDPDAFGIQAVVDANEDVIEMDEHLLIGATSLSVEEVVDLIRAGGGLAAASHVDREGFSITGQLGFVPPGLGLHALEISPRTTPSSVHARFPETSGFPLLCSSDAHRLSEIGTGWTEILAFEPTAAEVLLALRGEGGRRILRLSNG